MVEVDCIELMTIDIVDSFLQQSLSPIEYVLGFYLPKHHNNLGRIHNKYEYEEENIVTHEIPGTQLRVIHNRALIRLYTKSKRSTLFYPELDGELNGTVGMKLIYNGEVLLIPEVVVHRENLRLSTKYLELVLLLYRFVLNTRIGLDGHYKESVDFISKIPMHNYLPVACSYLQALRDITKSRCSAEICIVNPKHNGISCWVYVSQSTPGSLVLHTKHKDGFSYEYCGRLECIKDLRVDRPCAILVELIDQDDNSYYSNTSNRSTVTSKLLIALDMFSYEKETYELRYKALKYLLENSNSGSSSSGHNIGNNNSGSSSSGNSNSSSIGNNNSGSSNNNSGSSNSGSIGNNNGNNASRSEPYLSDYRVVPTLGREVSNSSSICQAMGDLSPNIDGYVMYTADNRPTKVKLRNMISIDAEYSYIVDKGTVIHKWSYTGVSEDPLTKYPYLEQGRVYVFEVRISDGSVVRIRNDRTRGNSKHVSDSIMRAYNKDKKYSLEEVWRGQDLRFTLLINRMFKYYVYMRYVPENSKVVDMGSGNGGDAHIWEERGYTLVAVEQDPTRCAVLRDKVKDNPKIFVKQRNMTELEAIMHNAPVRYTHATFMRSIGHLDREAIVTILKFLRRYKIVRVVIVTMLSELVESCCIVDGAKQHFEVNIQGSSTEVAYSVASKQVCYKDNSYTIDEWLSICNECGYVATVEYQWNVVSELYGLERSDILYPCTMDAVLILEISDT